MINVLNLIFNKNIKLLCHIKLNLIHIFFCKIINLIIIMNAKFIES